MRTRALGRSSNRYMRMDVLFLALVGLTVAVQPAHAGTVTDYNLSSSIAAATTAADHEAIAAYYQSKASEALAQAEAHKAMQSNYEKWGTGKEKMQHTFHCKDLIESYEKVAKSYETLAKEHLEMAKKAK